MRAGPKAEPRLSKLPVLRSKTPARRVEEFCRRFLVHQKGEKAGTSLLLTDWQRHDIVEPIFNPVENGRRRIRTAYITCPRKQGKTTIGAALALYLLYADAEPGAEIVSAAASRDQAAICFTIARQMVEASPALRDMTQVFQRELVIPSTGSRYRVIPADAPTAHGFNLSGCVIDELHAHPDRRLYDALITAMGARRQPLCVILTTAGTAEHSIAAEVHRYAEKVRDGVIEDPTFLPVIYAAPEDADPWDEAVWQACNPALRDGFRSLEEMRAAARTAKAVPGREPAFRQLYLNQWGTAAASRWLPLDAWDACAENVGPPPPFAGRRAFLGLDLASTRDLTALAIVLPADDGYDVRMEFWVPADTIAERERSDRVPYRLWVEQGWLHATPGNSTDYAYVEKRIYELMEELDVREIGADPWNARDLVTRLQTNAVPIFEVQQTMANLSTPSKALEKLILSRRLRHDGNPVMRWCVSNAVARTDANGNVAPDKKRSHEKIDGVSAVTTAMARALVATGPSVYDTRAPLVLSW
jgi:phage terminase large subunit-like protein